MSRTPQNSKKRVQPKPSTNPAVAWSVRAAVAGLCIGLLYLAWHEFQVKQAFSATASAWQTALRSKTENADLTKSEFRKIAVKGSPAVTTEKAAANPLTAVSVETYTWKGRLRTYAVKVSFGLGNDPPVEQVEVVGN